MIRFGLCFLIVLLGARVLAKDEKVLYMSNTRVETVTIRPGRATILSFPLRPQQVVKGSNDFDIKYIESDLAITALKTNARSNIFVYLSGRRYGFNLVASPDGYFDEVIIVKDKTDNKKIRVRIIDEG